MYGAVPPAAVTHVAPSDCPQFASCTVVSNNKANGSVTISLAVIKQPLASVIVTVCVPAQRLTPLLLI